MASFFTTKYEKKSLQNLTQIEKEEDKQLEEEKVIVDAVSQNQFQQISSSHRVKTLQGDNN
jgi:hypothetical protein